MTLRNFGVPLPGNETDGFGQFLNAESAEVHRTVEIELKPEVHKLSTIAARRTAQATLSRLGVRIAQDLKTRVRTQLKFAHF